MPWVESTLRDLSCSPVPNSKDEKCQAGRTGPVQSPVWSLLAAGKVCPSAVFSTSWRWLILAYRTHRKITFFLRNFTERFKIGILPPLKLFLRYFGIVQGDPQNLGNVWTLISHYGAGFSDFRLFSPILAVFPPISVFF